LYNSELISPVIEKLLQPEYLPLEGPMMLNDAKQLNQWYRIRERYIEAIVVRDYKGIRTHPYSTHRRRGRRVAQSKHQIRTRGHSNLHYSLRF
jgi:hypothetical protein